MEKRTPIRILHCLEDRNVGGAGVLLESVLLGYDRTRFQMIAAIPPDSALWERYRAQGIECVPLPELAPCDLIHAHACARAQLWAYRAGLPCVATRHCVRAPHPRLRRLSMRLPPFARTHWIAVSRAVGESLRREGVREAHLSVIPNGARPVTPVPRDAARTALGLAPTAFVVAFVGRLEPIKGADCFVEALITLCSTDPAVTALLAGDGSLRPSLQARVAALGLQGQIRFLGFCRDVAPILSAADVLVNASREEAHSLAVMEAMSVGCPVVGRDVSGNREVLRYGGGVLYRTDLVGVLATLRTDPAHRMSLGAHAKEAFFAHFSVETVIKKWEKVYLSMIR